MVDYSRLYQKLSEQGIKKSALGKQLGISSRTIAKMAKGEKLSGLTLEKISNYLGCNPDDLYRMKSENDALPGKIPKTAQNPNTVQNLNTVQNPNTMQNPNTVQNANRITAMHFTPNWDNYANQNLLLQMLREEKEARLSGGIYHELQVRMTYNSNHIEGSRLSEDQTRLIFETNTIDVGDGIPVDDILETVHHFRAIDYCIDHAEEPLSEDMIKYFHYILKHDTKDASLSWFAVGDYKKRANMVGGRETCRPSQVHESVQKLLDWYHSLQSVTMKDIITFHAEFEKIHPFQDGNGRVGRLIAFKECLNHNFVPFIIEDEKKIYYYRGLSQWDWEHGYLIDTCLDGQDTVKKLLDMLEISY